MRTLGPTYQLMILTVSQTNFAEVVDKASKVELGIKIGLVQDTPLTHASFSKTVLKKATTTWPEANFMQTIEVPWPN